MSTSGMPLVFSILKKKPWLPAAPVVHGVMAATGLVLFGCALLAAFRVMVLNADHQLQHPGIDFAICSMAATLALGVTRIFAGATSAQQKRRSSRA